MINVEGTQVVFDIVTQPYEPPWLVIGIGGAIWLAALLGLLLRRSTLMQGSLVFIVPIVVALFVAFTWMERQSLQRSARAGDAVTVEGRVEQFQTGRKFRPSESFVVSGEHFAVRASDFTAAYHRTASTGGPRLDGRCVRITYLVDRRLARPRNQIVRLETLAGCPSVVPP